MLRKGVRVLAAAGFVALLGVAVLRAQTSLGTAQSFAVVGGSTVTNTGPSVITGDLGVSPGTAVTGFFPPGIVTGTIHAGNAVAASAQAGVTAVWDTITPLPCADLTGQDLGGLNLPPGVYCFSSSAQLTGALVLNTGGNPTATWIFKTGSTLTTASGSSVSVIGGNPCGVTWHIGSSATLGTGTQFAGNLLAQESITLTTGANINGGRALARTAAVTLDTNNISFVPCGAAVPPIPTLSTWAAILLSVLLAVAGFVALRRRDSSSMRESRS